MDDRALLATLQALEVELHTPQVRSDRVRLGELLHAAFREFGRSGAVFSRDDVLAEFALSPPSHAIASRDFELVRLAEDVALLTYESAHVALDKPPARRTNRSSIWTRTTDGWQMVFHQGTPCSE